MLWQRALGLVRTVIEDVYEDPASHAVVVRVRPRKRAQRRCGRCGKRAGWFDHCAQRRRWRTLDAGLVRVLLEADTRRVNCPVHGPTVMAVPWARHNTGHSRVFDDTVAWLAVHVSMKAVSEYMRVSWRTVGAIVDRVLADIDADVDRYANLGRIGIDEISYKRGHKYLTVVVDHDTSRLVWAGEGRNEATLHEFFDLLGEERCAQIAFVSADAADWIARVVKARCPNATRCADPFHIVKWATNALDEVRRWAWNMARGGLNQSRSERHHKHPKVHPLKKVRWALWKNPDNLTTNQKAQLDWIAKTHPTLHRAYLLKETLRLVFQHSGQEAKDALNCWINWARRCRIPAFVRLQRSIVRHLDTIHATLDHGLTNGLTESTNTKIRLITRNAYGFRATRHLIALALLSLGNPQPHLPGRK